MALVLLHFIILYDVIILWIKQVVGVCGRSCVRKHGCQNPSLCSLPGGLPGNLFLLCADGEKLVDLNVANLVRLIYIL